MMANIYEQQSEEIHKLLERASAGDGATVVIPDLQRPFVWQPGQVVLLLDSLIRGWPFGTLLMWKVDHAELRAIPHREFWQVVDRTPDGDSAKIIRKDPPAQYHMVLDGQQRVQSLLLALCGDGWGFCLEDRDWTEQLTGNRPRGRRPKYPHWSKGTLCFDTEAFLAAYGHSEDVIGIDYRDVLKWAVTDPAKGQSEWSKPDNYKDPLPQAFAEEHKGRLIRLGRLWKTVSANPNMKEKQFRDDLQPFLEEQGVVAETIDRLLVPMGELMSTLRDVKLSKITYLELRPYDKDLWTEDEYNGAVVNIFTRLNTAGRTLTREEITFAWLKVGWDEAATDNRTAGDCFDALLREVRDKGLPIAMDDLVRAVSFIWSVSYRSGELLSDKDLLKGDSVQPMAGDLARAWSEIVEAIGLVLDIVRERDLQYGQNAQYYSVNSISILWAWSFLSRRWLCKHPLKVAAKDSYEKSLTACLEEYVDRWLICSHWAGRWGGSSSNVIADYARSLHSDKTALGGEETAREALGILSGRMASLVDEITSEATAHVQNYSVDRRSQVSRYRTLLWVWHRLEEKRWDMSQIPLRTGRRQKCDLEVDHTVAHSLWEQKVKALPPKDADEERELMQIINALGNCSLLEKTFNISKSNRPLKDFIAEVHEFCEGTIDPVKWREALGIVDEMFDPMAASTDRIREIIEKREAAIRADLVEFVQGNRKRQDLQGSVQGEDD